MGCWVWLISRVVTHFTLRQSVTVPMANGVRDQLVVIGSRTECV